MTAANDPPPDGRITTERLDRIFAIGIDRPKKLNGFSPKMLIELAEAFTAFERDEAAWVGLLYAHGANFTAGLELDKVAPFMRERGSVFPMGSIDPLSLRPPIRTKPLVCAVQGICFTLGIELMLAADIVIAAEDCRFAQIEVKRGIMPAGGATVRMVERAGWGNAQRYLLTGDEFGAAEALRLGFVQEVVPAGTQKEPRFGAGRGHRRAGAAGRARLARLLAHRRRSRPARRHPRVQRPAGPADGDGGRRRRACARSWNGARAGSLGGEKAGGMRIHYMSDVHLEFGALDKPLPQGRRGHPGRRHHAAGGHGSGQDGRQRATRSRVDAAVFRCGPAQLRTGVLPDGQPRALRLLHRRVRRTPSGTTFPA